MRKYTVRELRNFVKLGLAIDITENPGMTGLEEYEKIGYSCGIYGINGGLLCDDCGNSM